MNNNTTTSCSDPNLCTDPNRCCNKFANPKQPGNQTVMGNFVDLLHGFYREVFGSFVPGAITSAFFIILPFMTYLSIKGKLYAALTLFMGIGATEKATATLLSSTHTLFFIILSYAIGCILYRRAPKYVDAVASFRQWCFSSDEEKGKLTVQFKGKNDNYKTIHKSSVETYHKYEKDLTAISNKRGFWQHVLELFVDSSIGGGREDLILQGNEIPVSYPYPFLRSYLLQRGLTGLAQFVGWCYPEPKQQDKQDLRSKNAVNLLKYRIRYYGSQDMIHELDRNECNIRMLNSLWFSFRFVRTVIFTCFATLFVSSIIKFKCLIDGNLNKLLWLLVCDGIVLVLITLYGKPVADTNIRGQSKCYNQIIAMLVARQLPRIFLILSFAAMGFALAYFNDQTWFAISLIWLFYAVTFCRRNIEKGIHYVRERELIYILSSVDIIDGEMRDKNIFEDIKEATRQFESDGCSRCENRRRCYGNSPYPCASGTVFTQTEPRSPNLL